MNLNKLFVCVNYSELGLMYILFHPSYVFYENDTYPTELLTVGTLINYMFDLIDEKNKHSVYAILRKVSVKELVLASLGR